MKDNRDPIAEKIAEMEAEYLRQCPSPEVGKLYRVVSSYDFRLKTAYILRTDEPRNGLVYPKDVVERILLEENDCVHILDYIPINPKFNHAWVKVITPCGKIAWMSAVSVDTKPEKT